MTALLTQLDLLNIMLAQNNSGQFSLTATGQVVGVDPATGQATALPGVPPMQVGVGQTVAVPSLLQRTFAATGITVPPAATLLWLGTDNSTVPLPAWFGAFSNRGITLYGMHSLHASDVSLIGVTFGSLQLLVALQIEGTALHHAYFALSGSLTHDAPLAHVQIAGTSASFLLELNLQDVAALGAILADPASVLDAAFTGKLRFNAGVQTLNIGNYFKVEQGDMAFALDLSSPAGQRTLTLGDTHFTLSAGQVALLGASIEDLELACHYSATQDRLSLTGAASVTLPPLLQGVLDGSSGSTLSGRVLFVHDSQAQESSRLELRLDRLALDSALNFLELSARDLALTFVHPVGASGEWLLKLEGVACQSWSRLAQRLDAAKVLKLPAATRLPDLRGTLSLTLAENASQGELCYRLDLLDPGTGCRQGRPEVSFRNLLGPLPVTLADTFLTLHRCFDDGTAGTIYSWQVAGAGTISTTGWLRNLLPLTDATFTVGFGVGEGGDGEGGVGDSTPPELAFSVGGGLPALMLPAFAPGGGPIRIFQPTRLTVRLGEQLEIMGSATIPDPVDLVQELGVPAGWKPLLDQLQPLLTGVEASLEVRVPLADSGEGSTLSVTLAPHDPPSFGLMQTLGAIVTEASSAVDADTQIAADEFFTVSLGALTFQATVERDGNLSLALSLSLDCDLFGETFDATAALQLSNDQPQFLLMAGVTDPVRLVIPGLNPADVLGSFDENDITQILEDYGLQDLTLDTSLFPGLPSDPAEALAQIATDLQTLFTSPGASSSLIFEIRDFGLRVRLDQPPAVSGTVRLVQMPGFLDAILPPDGFDFGLGAAVDRIYIALAGPSRRDDQGAFLKGEVQPLFSVPLGQNNEGDDQYLHIYFGRFELEYSWASNAFGFVYDMAVIPEPASLTDFQVAGSGVFIPAQHTFIRVRMMIPPPPAPSIPIPEWGISFKRSGEPGEEVQSAADELGLQIYLGQPGPGPGDPETRFFTVYFRENRFSPSYYLMQPGLMWNGGVIIGEHSPASPASYRDDDTTAPVDHYEVFFDNIGKGSGDRFRAHLKIENWQLVLMPASLGLMLNPLAAIPPFLHPMPPFWVSPLLFMGDVFADSISASVNIPYLLFFSVHFARPLPTLSFKGMMELAALVLSGFQATIPEDSDLRRVLYVRLGVQARLPLLENIAGQEPVLDVALEANVADLVNAAIKVGQAAGEALKTGSDLVESLQQDPAALVRMIPLSARRFAFPTAAADLRILGFPLLGSGSIYVLTPEEFRQELVLYHESRRIKRKGLAASQPDGAAPTATSPLVTNPEGVQLQSSETFQLTYLANPLEYFAPEAEPFQEYVDAKLQEVLEKRQQSYEPFFRFREQRSESLRQLAWAIREDLARTRWNQPAARRRILQRHGLDAHANSLEDLLRSLLSPATPLDAVRGAKTVLEWLEKILRAGWPKEWTVIVGLDQSPAGIAAAIVADTVKVAGEALETTLSGPHLPRSPGDIEIPRQGTLMDPAARDIADADFTLPGGPDTPAGGDASVILPGGRVFVGGELVGGGDDVITPPGTGLQIIILSAQPPSGSAPLPVTFTPVFSAGSRPNSVLWNYGDPSSGSENTGQGYPGQHTYQTAGTYTVTVTASNSVGETDSRSVQVSVAAKPFLIIVPEYDRLTSYDSHLPGDLGARLSRDLEACFAGPLAQVQAGAVSSAALAEKLRRQIEKCLLTTILDAYPTASDPLETMDLLALSPPTAEAIIRANLATVPVYEQKNVEVTLFDGLRILSLLDATITAPPVPIPGVDKVRVVEGYEIRTRQPVPSGQPDLRIPVPTSTPIFTVRMQGGRYYVLLEVGGTDDAVVIESHTLPGWLTQDLPEGPGKADALRARLTVQQRVVERDRTAAEADFIEAEESEEAPHYYQSSIMARPEYRLKSSGGLHGPLTMADLLKTSRGDYIVPDSPLLLAGLFLDLYGHQVGLSGLLAGPDNIFLNGYHTLVIDLDPFELRLNGEFHLITGEMWQEALANSPTATAAGLEPNSVSFSGICELRHNGALKLKGSASGNLVFPAGQEYPRLDLSVAVQYHDCWTLTIADTELFKVTMDAQLDVNVTVKYNKNTPLLLLTARGELEVKASVVTSVPMKTVEISPTTTICGPVPVLPPAPPYMVEACVTVPAVTVDVPDLSAIDEDDWECVDAEATLSLALNLTEGLTGELIVTYEGTTLPKLTLTSLLNQ